MSNDSSWTSPGWAPPGGAPGGDPSTTPPPAPPGAGAPSGPEAPGSPSAAPAYGPGATGGWAPPPKPGLIPLRPIDFGTLFGATFQVLKRNPRPTFGAALLLNALVTILAFGLVFGLSIVSLDRLERASDSEADAIVAGTFGLIVLAGVVATAVALVAQALLQGLITIEVSRQILGEKNTLKHLFARGKGRWGALIGWTVLLSMALTVAIVILVGLVTLMIVIGGPAGIAVGVTIGVLGGLGLAVLGVWLWIKLALVPAAIMIERLTLGAAIGRAWRLIRGSFWRTLGILLLFTVIVQVAASVVSAPFSIAATFGGALFNPAGDELSAIVVLIGANLLSIAVTIIVGAIGAVLTTSAVALIYTDIRMRSEGLDIDLQQAVEQSAAGRTVDDPYMRGLGGETLPASAA
ncbi:hypothetical protein EV140_2322 [Microcella alkaliphila]|uniref:DUF7847 domain-containing protein n=1 Tax=Microcella alkaliphila TaxID=279828 RepID=A0A4Q7TCG4_9MICO|nr:hypothetical protein [Microcella alkaliphila]RZT58084.1 hypothetical protein EV140_2322 [Microcella alkaliphila]